MTEHISCDCNCKFNSSKFNSKQKWNNKTCQCDFKIIVKCQKDYRYDPSVRISENSKYLKSIDDVSVIECG